MQNCKQTAIAYYKALGKKNMEEVGQYLHPHIIFQDPQEMVNGKENVLQAAKRFSSIFTTLCIESSFETEHQAAIIYNVVINGLAKPLRASSLLTFTDGLISKIDLIYDMSSLRS